MKTTIYRYRCSDCPHRAVYLGSVPKKVPGAYLSFDTAASVTMRSSVAEPRTSITAAADLGRCPA